MPIAIVFFVHYAYLILFAWVLAEQLGTALWKECSATSLPLVV
jgi:hypothetical protein